MKKSHPLLEQSLNSNISIWKEKTFSSKYGMLVEVDLENTLLYSKDAVNKAYGAIIVWDWTKPETRDHLNEWKEILDENEVLPDNSPIPWIFVANKSDLLPEDAIPENSSDDLDITVYTSAKTGNNIQEAFMKLWEDIYQHNLSSVSKFVGWWNDAPTDNYNSSSDYISLRSLQEKGSFRLTKSLHEPSEKRKKKEDCKW